MIPIQNDIWLCCDGRMVAGRWPAYQHEKTVGMGNCSPVAYRHAERSHQEQIWSQKSGADWIGDILRQCNR